MCEALYDEYVELWKHNKELEQQLAEARAEVGRLQAIERAALEVDEAIEWEGWWDNYATPMIDAKEFKPAMNKLHNALQGPQEA